MAIRIHEAKIKKHGTYGFKLFEIIRAGLQVCLVQALRKVLCLNFASRGRLEGLVLNRRGCRLSLSRCRVGSTKEHVGNAVTNDGASCNGTSSSSHLPEEAWLTRLSRCRWCRRMSWVRVGRLWGQSR